MSTSPAKLDRIRIATPCPVSWEQMTGNDQVRFCDQCQLNVYNIAALTRIEAESLIASTEGRLCARLYRRPDGTVLTKDCPVGLRALRKRVSQRTAAVFAAMISFAAAAFGQQPAAEDKASCPSQTKITRAVNPKGVNGVVMGTVLDPTGAAIPGAKVTLTNTDTQQATSTIVNEGSRFEFTDVTPGNYEILVHADFGFVDNRITNIAIEAKQFVTIDTVVAFTAEPLSGIVSIPFENVEKRIPNTTVIDENMIRRLPMRSSIPDND